MLLLFQFCFCIVMRDFILSLSDNNQVDVIEEFNSTMTSLILIQMFCWKT